MNKIETLIKELCPNGVKYYFLKDVLVKSSGTKITASQMKEIHKDDGVIKIFAGGKTFAMVNPGDIPENDVIDRPSIIVKSRGIIEFEYYTKPFSHKAEFWSYHSENKNVNIKFIYYLLKNSERYFNDKASVMQMPQISSKDTQNFKIPIPPLEIQEEIVKILDKFTDYVTELTTELTLRQKQYNYYRDKLLSFENEVQIKKLSELATIKARIGWQGLTKKEYLKTGKYYLVTGTDFVKGTVNFSTCHFVEEERYLQDINIQLKNEDVLVTKDGTLGKVAYITNLPGPTTLNSGVFVVRKNSDEILSRYLYHYLNSPYLMKFAQSRLTGGTIKHLNQNVIVDFPIPIPDLEKQKEIIYILDSFNSIVNSLEKGLPKEIELRQKQYEYYRDKLLTFD